MKRDLRSSREIGPSSSDGERVGVVGQDRALSPDPLAPMAVEAGAIRPVVAFGVPDAALCTRFGLAASAVLLGMS